MRTMNKKGFTLIEILIVVAIIAILASIVLVGLGPTQALGRDSRRVSDLAEVQNGLELYYAPNGAYPLVTTAQGWGPGTGSLTADLETVSGVNSVPTDPSSGKSYIYGTPNPATTYILAATMESSQDGFWTNYVAPSDMGTMVTGYTTNGKAFTCSLASLQYCVTL
jgi:general secretion pathway protein G